MRGGKERSECGESGCMGVIGGSGIMCVFGVVFKAV